MHMLNFINLKVQSAEWLREEEGLLGKSKDRLKQESQVLNILQA